MHIKNSFVSSAIVISALLLAGCASDGSTAPGPTTRPASSSPALGMRGADAAAGSWKLTGSRIIACCCNTPCPCRMNYKPTHCHGCDNITAVHIDKGDINGVKMDGMDWIVAGCVFGEDQAKNWHYLYVSDKASPEQLAALTAMMEESMKGIADKAVFLAGEGKGMRQAPIAWEESSDGRDWSVKIPGVLDVQTRSIILPGRTKPVMTTGIFDDFGDRFIHADCVVHTLNDRETGYSWDLKGKQCNQADFTLTSEQVARGGIGWGCWSAHADLGDAAKTQYQEKATGHK